MMREIDKTKQNIKADHLDQNLKKELFEKFVKSGGQVIEEKRNRPITDFDRDKQRTYRQKIEASRQGAGRAMQQPRPGAQTRQVQRAANTQQRPQSAPGFIVRFFSLWHIRLRLFFMGITDFTAYYLKPGFMERFSIDYTSALMELQLLYLDLFKQNPVSGDRIIEELDRMRLLYFEVIEKTASVYEMSEIEKVVGRFSTKSPSPQLLLDRKDLLIKFFRKLYVLNPFKELILSSFERAIGLQMKIEKDKSSTYSLKRKKAKNNVYIVFNKFFYELYWLFCLFQEQVIPLSDPVIVKILGITEDEKVGSRIRSGRSKDIEAPEEKPEETDEPVKEEEIPPSVKKGLELMFQLDLLRLRPLYDREGYFSDVPENDKVLSMFLLFKEFDEEYSSILTTNKIKFNIKYTTSGKIDYRSRLSDLYNEQRRSLDVLHAYATHLSNMEKLKKAKPTSNTQMLEYSKKLTAMEKERSSFARDARMAALAFMEKVSESLKEVIDDMDNAQEIVDNPQEPLFFDAEIEGRKKLNKKKVYEAIEIVYNYALAFASRLGPGGDLASGLEFDAKVEEINKQKKEPKPEPPRTPQQKTPSPAADAPAAKKKDDKSVLEELDDLF